MLRFVQSEWATDGREARVPPAPPNATCTWPYGVVLVFPEFPARPLYRMTVGEANAHLSNTRFTLRALHELILVCQSALASGRQGSARAGQGNEMAICYSVAILSTVDIRWTE